MPRNLHPHSVRSVFWSQINRFRKRQFLVISEVQQFSSGDNGSVSVTVSDETALGPTELDVGFISVQFRSVPFTAV